MRQQALSVVLALALASGLLAALLYGPGQPGGSSRASRAAVPTPPAASAPAADETPPAPGAHHDARLLVLDVANPARVAVVGESEPLPNAIRGLVLDGSRAYLIDPARGVRTFDVFDPTHPTDAGTWDAGLTMRGLVARRGHVYVADYAVDPYEYYENRVAVHDDEAWRFDRPVPRNAPLPPDSQKGIGMAIQGDHLYVAAQVGGLWALDVRDHAQPVLLSAYRAPDSVLGVAVEGRYAYLATYTKGLRVVDVADPTAPVEVGAYRTPGVTMDVAVAGRYAYVADHTSGVHVVDLAEPTNPRQVAVVRPPYYPTNVVVAGGYLYVSDGACGLRIVDVRNPRLATEVGHYPALGVATAVAAAGRYAYLAVTRADAARPCVPPTAAPLDE